MHESVATWRKSGKYLPRFLRDFHDQKDTFKAIHDTVNVMGHEYVKDISWVAGQCYVIDIFLWFMARHGYVLRRAHRKLPFDDIEITTHEAKERFTRAMGQAMGLTPIDRH